MKAQSQGTRRPSEEGDGRTPPDLPDCVICISDGLWASTASRFAVVLRDAFSMSITHVDFDGSSPRIGRATEQYCETDTAGRFWFPFGLLDVAQRALADAGYRVVIRDLRQGREHVRGGSSPHQDPVHVSCYGDLTRCPAPRESTSPLYHKRLYLWLNRERNDALAAIARSLTTQPEPGSGEVAGHLDTVIVVESAEHGRQLQERLPGWVLIAGYSASSLIGGSSCIMTQVQADAQGVLLTRNVMWAGGGNGAPRLPALASVDHRPVTLIDVLDEGDPAMLAASHSRLGDYRSRGWRIFFIINDKSQQLLQA